MATVTGFTAERMLQIENTTVVDGDVVGNNLILKTREGTTIDAGNVRGPQGIQGIPGPVPSVNGQTGAVTTPRSFTDETALKSQWASAPDGAEAVTQTEGAQWNKIGGVWYPASPIRTFLDKTELLAKWPSAPNGSRASTMIESAGWDRVASTWRAATPPRIFATRSELVSTWTDAPVGSLAVTADTNIIWRKTPASGWTDPSPRGMLAAPYVAGDVGAYTWASPGGEIHPNLYATITLDTTRKLEVSAHLPFFQFMNVPAGQYPSVDIQLQQKVGAGTWDLIQMFRASWPVDPGTAIACCHFAVQTSPPAGTRQYRLAASQSFSSHFINFAAAAMYPMYMQITDLGGY